MKISFIEFAILKTILEHNEKNGRPPYQTELVRLDNESGLVNEWLDQNGVDDISYASPLKSMAVLGRAITKWRLLGMLDATKRHYVPTKQASELFEKLDADWRNWPVSIEVDNEGNILWETAKLGRKAKR